MASWLARLMLLAAAGGLQGCASSVLYAANRPSDAVLAEMARWCARDSGVAWRGPRPAGLVLWAPGHLGRAPEAEASLAGVQPHRDFEYGVMLLRSGLARQVLINVRRDYHDPLSGAFGPSVGEPAGVYRLELRPPGDARCAPYLALRARVERWGPAGQWEEAGRQPCPAYDYVGPFDDSARPDMYVTFSDEAARKQGFSRGGAVLFVAGRVRATEVRYGAVGPHGSSEHAGAWGVKACAPFVEQIAAG